MNLDIYRISNFKLQIHKFSFIITFSKGNRMNVSARAILAAAWGAIIIAAFAAPFLMSRHFPTAAFFTYLPFSFICHQMPERSFAILGRPLAVCHRCSGIYLGFFLGTLLSSFILRIPSRVWRTCMIAAAAFLALDAILPLTGIWNGFRLCRFLTGLFFGVAAAPFAVVGLDEIISLKSFKCSLKEFSHE